MLVDFFPSTRSCPGHVDGTDRWAVQTTHRLSTGESLPSPTTAGQQQQQPGHSSCSSGLSLAGISAFALDGVLSRTESKLILVILWSNKTHTDTHTHRQEREVRLSMSITSKKIRSFAGTLTDVVLAQLSHFRREALPNVEQLKGEREAWEWGALGDSHPLNLDVGCCPECSECRRTLRG